jgi:hypothetical protein
MSEYFDQFIIGTLLGDSYITKSNQFRFSHSVVQKDYFLHKAQILKDAGMVVTVNEKPITGFSTNPTLVASCSRKHLWKPLREKFYPNGEKIVPPDITLPPVSLAYWFMDDGNANLIKHYNNHGVRVDVDKPVINKFRLYTDGFDDESQNYLAATLLEEHGVRSGFYLRKKNNLKYMEIRDKASKEAFKSLVSPYIIDPMRYKIDHEVSFSR